MNLCIECGERPVFNKKRNLCRICYQQYIRKGGAIKSQIGWKVKSRRIILSEKIDREFVFIKNYFNHNNWVRHPATFRFDGATIYAPDFYDGERNVFIEVVGSRQAYHQNKEKYELMKSIYPKINFEIRTVDGALIQIGDNLRLIWPDEVNG